MSRVRIIIAASSKLKRFACSVCANSYSYGEARSTKYVSSNSV